ncbi:MAG: glycosyltransferase family 4 protein [Methanobacterium formicicum]
MQKEIERKRKLVLFTSNLSGGAGGAEKLVLEEEKYFKKLNFDTTLITFAVDEIAVYDYKPNILEIKIKSPKLFSQLIGILKLRKELKKINPNYIIAQSNYCSFYIYFATLFTHFKYITHIHGSLFWFDEDQKKYAIIHKKVFSEIRNSIIGHKEFIPKNYPLGLPSRVSAEILAIIDYLVVRKAEQIIVITEQLKWEVEKLYNKKAIVSRGCLPNNFEEFKPKRNIKNELNLHNKEIIFSLGRLDHRKRIDILIKAFHRITNKNDDVVLLIGGIGKEEKNLKMLVSKLKIDEKVKFLGFVDDDSLFEYYSACDVFAFPSWTSSGISPYEALSVGKKVVITSEAEEPFLNHESVFIAEPNVDSFSKYLKKALECEVKEKIDLSEYTWDNYFQKVYDALLLDPKD